MESIPASPRIHRGARTTSISRLYALLMLCIAQLAASLTLADGLGPGGYWAVLVFFVAVLVVALLLLMGLVALVVWLIRRRDRRSR